MTTDTVDSEFAGCAESLAELNALIGVDTVVVNVDALIETAVQKVRSAVVPVSTVTNGVSSALDTAEEGMRTLVKSVIAISSMEESFAGLSDSTESVTTVKNALDTLNAAADNFTQLPVLLTSLSPEAGVVASSILDIFSDLVSDTKCLTGVSSTLACAVPAFPLVGTLTADAVDDLFAEFNMDVLDENRQANLTYAANLLLSFTAAITQALAVVNFMEKLG